MGWLAGIVVAVAGTLAVLAGVYLVGMRTKSRLVRRVMIEFTKRVVNPRMIHTAGQPGASASLIRHVGRTSGHAYETPVGAEPVEDGFVVALPYGTQPNWLRNVLAAGEATVVHDGVEHRVDRPEVVPLEPVGGVFSPSDQRLHRMFGVDEALRVRLAASA